MQLRDYVAKRGLCMSFSFILIHLLIEKEVPIRDSYRASPEKKSYRD